jgi:fructose-specific phosphotransferase system IIC component
MSRLFLASVVTSAAVGEALFPPKLIQVALGFPLSFCPSGALAAGIIAGHFIALGSFVFVVLALVRQALPTPWRIVWAAVVGSLTTAVIIWWCFAQPQVWSWILGTSGSHGAAWDAARWTKALGTGVGGLLGVALAGARQNDVGFHNLGTPPA